MYKDNELRDFKNGLEAGIFIYPKVVIENGQARVNNQGALLYLSKRTVKSKIARFYLFNEKSEYFKLVHSEDDVIVGELKKQGINSDFIEYQGFRGPIKIWEVGYPLNIKINEEYLKTDYPLELDVKKAKRGYYN